MRTNDSKTALGKTSTSRQRAKPKEIQSRTDNNKELEKYNGFADYLYSKGFSHSSVGTTIASLQPFIKWIGQQHIPQEQVSYNDITLYILTIKNNMEQSSVYKYANSIRHYYDYLVSIKEVQENPIGELEIKGIKRRKLHNILSRQELESLYNNYTVPDENGPNKNQNWFKLQVAANKRNKVMLGLLIWQGLRSDDFALIDVNDVKLREGKIYIPGGRRNNERTLKLEAHQVLDMMEYIMKIRPEILKLTGKETTKLIISTGKGADVHNTMNQLMTKLRALQPALNDANQLRSSVITHWLKIHNLREVQYMAGHRYVSSTERYLINDVDDLLDEISKYHPIG